MLKNLAPTHMIVESLMIADHQKIWDVKSVDSLPIDIDGIPGERHYGRFRTLVRNESPAMAGISVLNDRQVSVLDSADMRQIAQDMGLPIDTIEERTEESIGRFMARQLAGNILLRSAAITLNSAVNASTVMCFGNAGGIKAAIKIFEYNNSCNQPMTKLVHSLGDIGLRPALEGELLRAHFKKVARSNRGRLV